MRWHQLHYKLDEHDEPVPVDEAEVESFMRWLLDNDHTLAFSEVEGVRVSTTFLGLDHGGFVSGGPPVLWETVVVSPGGNLNRRLYASQSEALAGHTAAVGAILGKMPAGRG